MTNTDLKPCPECRGSGLELTSVDLDDGVSPCWRCHGDGMLKVATTGNTRADTALSQSADLIAEAEAIAERLTTSLDATKALRDLTTALRAAEAREKELHAVIAHMAVTPEFSVQMWENGAKKNADLTAENARLTAQLAERDGLKHVAWMCRDKDTQNWSLWIGSTEAGIKDFKQRVKLYARFHAAEDKSHDA